MTWVASLLRWITRTPRPVRYDLRVARMPQMWICPAPGAPDLADALSWCHDRALPAVVQLYSHHFQLSGHDPAVEALRGVNALGQLATSTYWSRADKAPLAIESGCIKPGQDTEANAGVAAQCVMRAVGLGAEAPVLVMMDEPLTAALYLQSPTMPVSEACLQIVEYQDRVAELAPEAEIGWVEAYPTVDVETIASAVAFCGPVACLHLDLDLNAMRQKGMRQCKRDLLDLQHRCREMQIPFGVVLWGCRDETTASWLASARELLAECQSIFGRDWPDHVVVQSWSRVGDEPRRIPPTLPQRGESLWGFLHEVKCALQGVRPSWP